MDYEVIIIGAGYAGLAGGIGIDSWTDSYLILEQRDYIGQLRTTGGIAGFWVDTIVDATHSKFKIDTDDIASTIRDIYLYNRDGGSYALHYNHDVGYLVYPDKLEISMSHSIKNHIQLQTRVLSIKRENCRYHIHTDKGDYTAKHIINASGIYGINVAPVSKEDMIIGYEKTIRVDHTNNDNELKIYFDKSYAPNGYVWDFSGGHNIRRVGLGFPMSFDINPKIALETFMKTHNYEGELIHTLSHPIPVAYPLDRVVDEHIAYVGDAGRYVFASSLHPDERVLVKNKDGLVNFVKISDLDIKEYPYVATYDFKEHKTKYAPIAMTLRHKLTDKLYKVRFRSGREILITSSHNLFVYENGKVVLKKTTDLKVDDYCFAVFNPPKDHKIIDIPKHIAKIMGFYMAEGYVRDPTTHMDSKNTRWHLKLVFGNNEDKYINEIVDTCNELGIETKIEHNKSSPWHKSIRIYSRPQFYNTPEHKRFTENEYRTIIDYKQNGLSLNQISETLNISENRIEWLLYSPSSKTITLPKIDLQQYTFPHLSHNKYIPIEILNASDDIKLEFLRGYFLGDGNFDKGCGISFVTVSYNLAKDVIYLLHSLRVPATISRFTVKSRKIRDKEVGESIAYRVSVYGSEYLKKIEYIWKDKDGADEIYNYINSIKNSDWTEPRILNIPNSTEIRKEFKRLYNKKVYTKYLSRKYILKYFPENKIANSDAMILKIDAIEEIDYDGYVYDLSVPPYENFITDNGIIAHNTGGGIHGAILSGLNAGYSLQFGDFKKYEQWYRDFRVYLKRHYKIKKLLYSFTDAEFDRVFNVIQDYQPKTLNPIYEISRLVRYIAFKDPALLAKVLKNYI